LADSDEAVEQLIHLRTTERDEKAAADLHAMQDHCSAGLVDEEAKLIRMCLEYPGWAEPYSRLTSLLYVLGRTAEDVDIAEHSLKLKPWHFEVLQMTILLSRHENSDNITKTRARRLAQQSMPELDEDVEGRKKWVARALTQAAQQLEEAEAATAANRREYHRRHAFELS
jgi:hypothetical protein